MVRRLVLLFLCGILLTAATNPSQPDLCGVPPLSALRSHVVSQGQTLEAIAQQHNLTVATLQGLNPTVRSGQVKVGETLMIPPFDGLVHRFANDETYRTVAEKYRLRPDVLFERNACQLKPEAVFIPGAVWRPDPVAILTPTPANPTLIINSGGYPLPYVVPVTSGYGWRMHPITGEMAFHAGIDLGAAMGTPVLATLAGTVTYASPAGGFGNLVEINHGSNLTTRYAHLAVITTTVGQRLVQGQRVGLVGATGRVTGAHLHFETLVPSSQGWSAINPAPFLAQVALRR